MVASADPTACASQDEVLASNTATESNVHWRTLITAVLILVLLPISSIAAVCEVNCRTNGMSKMAMSSVPPHTSHNAGLPAAQHHHGIAPNSEPNVVAPAALPHQLLAGHACCNALLPTLTSPCVKSQNNTLQEQIVAAKWSPTFRIVQAQVSGLLLFKEYLIFKEYLSRNSIPLASVPLALSHSLSLRI
jgi:hypothetical protein